MKSNPYIDAHPLRGAFIANQLEHLAALIVAQAQDMLSEAGLTFPSRAVSTILYLCENGPVTTAEIAAALNQPHQLVTQRVETLITAGIIKRCEDARDRRRKLLQLTPEGHLQVQTLKPLLAAAENAIQGLFDECGCDLSRVSQDVVARLGHKDLTQRVKAVTDKVSL